MASLIPDEWKRKVRDALNSSDKSRCIVRFTTAELTWQATFPDTFNFQMLRAISDALAAPSIEGALKRMDEPTETYAFFVTFRKNKMYAKVGLYPDGKIVIVYSAHKPDKNKGDTL